MNRRKFFAAPLLPLVFTVPLDSTITVETKVLSTDELARWYQVVRQSTYVVVYENVVKNG